MIHERVLAILATCDTDVPLLSPAQLYNEGWLLRLILDWFSTHPVPAHPLSFYERSRWFSEARLPPAFLPRTRGNELAESLTHADGVIGHFTIGEKGKADLSLWPDATHFVVLEANLFHRRSADMAHAGYCDQAACTVACMAETLKRALRSPGHVPNLAFYILAPRARIELGIFAKAMDRESVQWQAYRRIEDYPGDGHEWYHQWFQPTSRRIQIGTLSWEGMIETIDGHDAAAAGDLQDFYDRCFEYSQ